MKNVALYVRVSTQEQKKHGLSVDSQIKALQEYCSENDLRIVGIYNDAGISARKKYTKRPALLRMVEDCKAGKIDQILFTKIDRFFRSVGDYYDVMNQIDVPWRAIWEDYETETSSGIFKVNIMLAVSQSEADRTSERIKSTMQYKKERGDYVGSAPIGYVVRGRDLIKDERIEKAMNHFFEKYFATLSLREAIKEADLYGLKLNQNHMNKLIKNPTYFGECSNGYKCDPYITKDQHDLIINTMQTRIRASKDPQRIFLFSGLCICGYCGHRMPAKAILRKHADGKIITHKKYVCQYNKDARFKCPHLQISEPMLENYLLSELSPLLDQRRIEIKEQNADADLQLGAKKKADLENKLKRIANLYEDGDMSLEDYRIKRDSIKSEIASIVIEPISEPAELPDEWIEIYNDLDDVHKRSFWKKIIKGITITNENKNHPEIEFL